MRFYTADSAVSPRLHGGHVEHEEIDISDDELLKLKARARRGATMDANTTPAPETPRDRPVPDDYAAWLRGER